MFDEVFAMEVRTRPKPMTLQLLGTSLSGSSIRPRPRQKMQDEMRRCGVAVKELNLNYHNVDL